MGLAAMGLAAFQGPVASAAVLKKAELTAVINEVRLLDPAAGERGAKIKDVVEGEIGVKTGIQSRAELLFQDKTLTRLGANTLFSFNEGTRNLELERGTMLLQCPKGVGGAKIRTAAVTAAITGTTILLEYSPAPTPKRPRGYIPTIAEMTPDECFAELQHPRRNYTKAERASLQGKAGQRKKGGSGGYVKVLVLEGTLRLFLNTRLGESVLISAGHMIILDPQAIAIPPAVEFDIQRLAETSLLVDNRFWGGKATDLNMAVVAREVTIQDKLKDRGTLLETNLVIPGAGTEVVTLAQLNQSIQAQEIAFISQQQPGGVGVPGSGPSGTTPSSPGTGSSSPFLSTITSPSTYVVGGGSVIETDPSITTNGITDYGTLFSAGGNPAMFLYGSESAFDDTLFGPGDSSSKNIFAVFKFSNLQLSGVPGILTTGGAPNLALISEGPITTSLPGGAFNLDVLNGFFMSTVNGSITMGPEFSFTSTVTFTPSPTSNDPGMQLYARGPTSDVVFGSTVNFADRDFELDAEHDVVVSSQITALSSTDPLLRDDADVRIMAGNHFVLNSSGLITASDVHIIANDVVGSGSALVDAVSLTVDLQSLATLTQTGGLFHVNTLPVSQTNLQDFFLSGVAGVTVTGNVTVSTAPSPSTGRFVGLRLRSDAGDVIINGNLTTNKDLRVETDHNFIVGPSGLVTAQNIEVDALLASVTLPGDVTFATAPNPGGGTDFVGVTIRSDNGDVTINGHLVTNNDLRIESDHNFILGPGGLLTAQSVEIHSPNAGITLPGDVTAVTAVNPGGGGDFVGLSVHAESGDVTVNGHLTTNHSLEIDAQSGNFILGPGGRLTAPDIRIDNIRDVAGSGAAVVDGASATINIQIQNAATLTQSGNLLFVNTLPIDQASPLQNLFLTATAGLTIPSNVNINVVPGGFTQSIGLNSDGVLTINGTLSTSTGLFIQVRDIAAGPLAFLQAPNVNVTLTGPASPATVNVAGNNLLFNSLPIDLSIPGSYTAVSAPTIQVAPNLVLPAPGGVGIGASHPIYDTVTHAFTGWTSDNVQVAGNITATGGLNLGGIANVTGNVDVGGLGVGEVTVGGTVTAGNIFWAGQYSYYNSTGTGPVVATAASLTAPVVDANAGLSFAGANEGSGMGSNNAFPDDGHVFTLSTGVVVFDTSGASPYIGPATFDGGDALPGGSNAGGNGGTFTLNATGDVTVNTPISATTGANATGVTSGGNGGTVNLNSTNGAVTVNSTIQVSSADVPNHRVSKTGGNIAVKTGKTSGAGINIANTGQLLSLLDATAPGPGGTVQVVSAGADINVSGKVQADRGTIDVHNNGPSGQVFVNSTAQLAADVVKVGALGANGQLTIQAGSQINATSTLKLYGGSGALGSVLFTGSGNVNLSGSAIHVAATTVQIDPATHVNNSGTTFVHSTTSNFGVGAGGGKFQNAVTQTPLSGAPSY